MTTLATLRGSTAQVNWAKGIRKKRLEEIDRWLVLARQGLDVLGTVPELEELRRLVCGIDEAKGFIDTRDEPLIEAPDRSMTLGMIAGVRVAETVAPHIKDRFAAEAPPVLARWRIHTED